MVKTRNTTVDLATHRLWGQVSKNLDLNRIDTLRFLVAKQASRLGLKVPKTLEEFV